MPYPQVHPLRHHLDAPRSQHLREREPQEVGLAEKGDLRKCLGYLAGCLCSECLLPPDPEIAVFHRVFRILGVRVLLQLVGLELLLLDSKSEMVAAWYHPVLILVVMLLQCSSFPHLLPPDSMVCLEMD